MKLRVDINVFMFDDPGVVKSQFLKFVEKVPLLYMLQVDADGESLG